jgi:hypothetical protein
MSYMDRNGYQRTKQEHSNLVHRGRIYHVYLENRDKYPLPFSAYEIHHIDFDKTNNKVSNLAILTPTEHDDIHDEEKQRAKEDEERRIRIQHEMNLSLAAQEKREKEEREFVEEYGIKPKEMASYIRRAKKEYDVSEDQLHVEFFVMANKIQKEHLQDVCYKRYGECDKYHEMVKKGMEYQPEKRILLKVWDALFYSYENQKIKAAKAKIRKAQFNLIKTKMKGKVKNLFNKDEKMKTRKTKPKDKFCNQCGRAISHKGNCYACNIKLKMEKKKKAKNKNR